MITLMIGVSFGMIVQQLWTCRRHSHGHGVTLITVLVMQTLFWVATGLMVWAWAN